MATQERRRGCHSRIWQCQSFLVFFSYVISVVGAQGIIYPTEVNGPACTLPNGFNGFCKDHRDCPLAFKDFPRVKPKHCGFDGSHPIVCCPVESDRIKNPDVVIPITDISPPQVDFDCGDSTPTEVFLPFLEDFPSPEVPSSISHQPSSSLRVARQQVPLTGGSFTDDPPDGIPTTDGNDLILEAVGGLEARRVLSKYTALIGSPDASGIVEWICTGVLINTLWVLTAAHCAHVRTLTTVRLGEHDYSNDTDGANPIDFDIIDEVRYPGYSFPQQDHDLSLLKLSAPAPLGIDINPACLPWGRTSAMNLINRQITLTGWGAIQFGGIGSPLLQEVNVTVFENAVCHRSYSELRDFRTKWPHGIRENVLCAGDPEGGKDACGGDSGGPVTYLDSNNRYVLAGIVSSGYGCGLREYPGLYASLSHPPYLAWIKQVAFL